MLHQVLFRCGAREIGSVICAWKILEVLYREGIIEIITESVIIQDTVLWIPIIAKKYRVELAAVLLSQPVNAIDVGKR